jgi:hypothetical protein
MWLFKIQGEISKQSRLGGYYREQRKRLRTAIFQPSSSLVAIKSGLRPGAAMSGLQPTPQRVATTGGENTSVMMSTSSHPVMSGYYRNQLGDADRTSIAAAIKLVVTTVGVQQALYNLMGSATSTQGGYYRMTSKKPRFVRAQPTPHRVAIAGTFMLL